MSSPPPSAVPVDAAVGRPRCRSWCAAFWAGSGKLKHDVRQCASSARLCFNSSSSRDVRTGSVGSGLPRGCTGRDNVRERRGVSTHVHAHSLCMRPIHHHTPGTTQAALRVGLMKSLVRRRRVAAAALLSPCLCRTCVTKRAQRKRFPMWRGSRLKQDHSLRLHLWLTRTAPQMRARRR